MFELNIIAYVRFPQVLMTYKSFEPGAKFNGQTNGKQRRRAKIINVNFAINVPSCLSFQLTIITQDFHMVRLLNMDDFNPLNTELNPICQ